MMSRKYYRAPWFPDTEAHLVEWWPHFGTYVLAEELDFTRQQVKGKADKLGLVMLPKTERICIKCRKRNQVSRRYGLRCRECSLDNRRERARRGLPLEEWVGAAVRTARHRSREPSDIDTTYMLGLWHKQGGRCFYTGRSLVQPRYTIARNPSPHLLTGLIRLGVISEGMFAGLRGRPTCERAICRTRSSSSFVRRLLAPTGACWPGCRAANENEFPQCCPVSVINERWLPG